MLQNALATAAGVPVHYQPNILGRGLLMDVKFVDDEGGLATSAGFIERVDGRETRFVRVPVAMIRLVVEAPKIHRIISYKALRDARRTEKTPSFPGRQCSTDLQRSMVTTLSGSASLSGLGARRRTTMSPLGGVQDLTKIDVRLQTARLEETEEITGFTLDWFCEKHIEPLGGFIFHGWLMRQDIDLLVEELRTTSGNLEIHLTVGLFPGIFGEWSFEGWDGGKLKFANREICSRIVANHGAMPKDFFDPEKPFDTRVETVGPHELLSLQVISKSETH